MSEKKQQLLLVFELNPLNQIMSDVTIVSLVRREGWSIFLTKLVLFKCCCMHVVDHFCILGVGVGVVGGEPN